jgi:RnfABCDGE-type electron transport complex B subunit
MNVDTVINAVLMIGGMGLFVAVFLGIASVVFKVEVDPKEEEVLEALPGNNCGACGFPGCAGLASAIVKGDAKVNACPVGGAACAERLAKIMGVDAESIEPKVAFVRCAGECDKRKDEYEYYGVENCSMVSMVSDGVKPCSYGCMGHGDCVAVCEFDAIHIVNGIAVVDKDACKSCEKCVAACPRNIIDMIPVSAVQKVKCVSKDKAPLVIKQCDAGCIGCKKCERACPVDAIKVTDFCAEIDYTLCIHCGKCVEECPRDIIVEV